MAVPPAGSVRFTTNMPMALYRYAVMILADPARRGDAVHQVFLGIARRPAGHIQCDERYLRRAVRNECYSIAAPSPAGTAATDAPLLEAVPRLTSGRTNGWRSKRRFGRCRPNSARCCI